jgi:hypothetical protein
MFIVDNPGLWQDFTRRRDNVGLPIMEVRTKYLREQLAYDNFVSFVVSQQRIINQTSQGGGPSQEVVPSLPSGCIEFVNNTSDGTECLFWIETSAPTNYTITWGDGETTTGQTTSDENGGVGDGDGSNKLSISHGYADSDTEYTARICFDDISLVTYLEFHGDD